ncbi:MAG: Hsp20/alpha crystallin family protein [Gammaproteobacteria bacterium]
MALIPYDPADMMNRLNRQLENAYGMPSIFGDEESDVMTSRWTPAVDIREEENAYVIHADIPGVEPDKIEVRTENNILSIRGERQEEKEEDRAGYKRIERSRGSFYRRFNLPDNADTDGIKASSANGVLELRIPKKETGKARKVKVNG